MTSDMGFVGTQTLDILVESIDYPDEIEPIVVSILIEVESCEVTALA